MPENEIFPQRKAISAEIRIPIRMPPLILKWRRTAMTSSPVKKMSDGGSVTAVFSVICPASMPMMPPFFSPTMAMKSPIPATMAFFREGLSAFSISPRSFVNDVIRKRMPEIRTTPMAVRQTVGSPIFPPVTAAQLPMTLKRTKKFVPIPGARPIG